MVRDGAHLFKSRAPLCKLFNMVDSAAAGGAAAPPRAIPWGVSDLGGVTEAFTEAAPEWVPKHPFPGLKNE